MAFPSWELGESFFIQNSALSFFSWFFMNIFMNKARSLVEWILHQLSSKFQHLKTSEVEINFISRNTAVTEELLKKNIVGSGLTSHGLADKKQTNKQTKKPITNTGAWKPANNVGIRCKRVWVTLHFVTILMKEFWEKRPLHKEWTEQ